MRKLEYEDYKIKLENQEKNLQLLLYSTEKNKCFLYKPKMQSIYGTQSQKNNYFKALRQKLKINKTNTDKKISFITLTYDTKLYSAEKVVHRCKRDIQLWLKLLRARLGKINYFWIVELTKKNYVHFHIIMKEYIPSKIINACWHQVTGSIITNVKGISRTRAARYITKYVSDATKLSSDQAKFLYDNDFKRLYSNSKGFFMKKSKPKGIYYLIGVITNPFCIVSANSGEFLEIETITLNYLIELLEGDTWGYTKKF